MFFAGYDVLEIPTHIEGLLTMNDQTSDTASSYIQRSASTVGNESIATTFLLELLENANMVCKTVHFFTLFMILKFCPRYWDGLIMTLIEKALILKPKIFQMLGTP